MPHDIPPEDQHKWKKLEIEIEGLIPKEKDLIIACSEIQELSICTRGDCRCIRMTRRKYGQTLHTYVRSGGVIMKSERPDCFGDTPINEQTID